MKKSSTFYSYLTLIHEQRQYLRQYSCSCCCEHPEALNKHVTNVRTTNQDVTRRGRGGMCFPTELLALFAIMERILPMGPTEWEMVIAKKYVEFPGCDVNSIRGKNTFLHRKKILTGNPNTSLRIKMAKHIKYKIGDKVELFNSMGHYDMMGQMAEMRVGDVLTDNKHIFQSVKENIYLLQSQNIQSRVLQLVSHWMWMSIVIVLSDLLYGD